MSEEISEITIRKDGLKEYAKFNIYICVTVLGWVVYGIAIPPVSILGLLFGVLGILALHIDRFPTEAANVKRLIFKG